MTWLLNYVRVDPWVHRPLWDETCRRLLFEDRESGVITPFFNRSHSENLRSPDHLSSVSVISMLCPTTLLTSRSSEEMSSRSRGSSGHSISGNDRKLGLIIQRCSPDSLCPFKGDASSAGLRLFSSCRQTGGKVSSHFVYTSTRLYFLTSRIYFPQALPTP